MRKSPAVLAVIAVVTSLLVIAPASPASAASVAGTGVGYWEVHTDGTVFSAGSALSVGGVKPLHTPIVGISAQPGGTGFVLAGVAGGVFTYGTAKFLGSMGGTRLKQPIVGVAYTPTGNGYYLVAADGGIFTFGDAVFRGSTGAIALNSPIVGMAVTATGKGYWLVAADGGIFTFGDAVFRGSAAAHRPRAPIVGIAATRNGRGYWVATRNGAVYAFGNAPFLGAVPPAVQPPVTAIATSASGAGYVVMGRFGQVAAFGDAPGCIVYNRGRTLQTGSGREDTIGIAIPFNAATLSTFYAGTCGRPSKAFRAPTRWHISITRSQHKDDAYPQCQVVLARARSINGASTFLDAVTATTPGTMQVRATQMAGAKSFRISAGPCLAIARPGTGGTEPFPFTSIGFGDTLPFTSAAPITLRSRLHKRLCHVQVFRDDDGSLVLDRSAHRIEEVIPAGTYFMRTEDPCWIRLR